MTVEQSTPIRCRWCGDTDGPHGEITRYRDRASAGPVPVEDAWACEPCITVMIAELRAMGWTVQR